MEAKTLFLPQATVLPDRSEGLKFSQRTLMMVAALELYRGEVPPSPPGIFNAFLENQKNEPRVARVGDECLT
jgi:hypothetical protein